MRFLNTLFLFLIPLFLVNCQSSSSSNTIISYTVSLPDNSATIIANRTSQINVIANYSNGETKNVNNTLIWSSSDTNVATVTNGLVSTANVNANVTIYFESSEKLSNGKPIYSSSAALTVQIANLQSISISPASPSVSEGLSTTLIATGSFDNNSTLTITDECNWSSSDTTIAQITGKGIVKGISSGSVQITAKDSQTGINSSVTLGVTQSVISELNISATASSFNKDETIQMSATGKNTKNETLVLTNDVNWTSSDTAIVTIDSSGLATAVAIGDANITATRNDINFTSNKVTLNVIRDTYVQLYNDANKSVGLPYVNYTELASTDTNTTLGKFTLRAIGGNFTISNLKITTLNNLYISTAAFSNITNGQVINQDTNQSFELRCAGTESELVYSFTVDSRLFSVTFKRSK